MCPDLVKLVASRKIALNRQIAADALLGENSPGQFIQPNFSTKKTRVLKLGKLYNLN